MIITIPANKNAELRSAEPNTNYWNAPVFEVYTREDAVKQVVLNFPLTGIRAPVGLELTNVQIRFTAELNGYHTVEDLGGELMYFDAWPMEEHGWLENTITWNNCPSHQGFEGPKKLNYDDANSEHYADLGVEIWYVRDRIGVFNNVSFVVDGGRDGYHICSRLAENPTNRPRLILMYGTSNMQIALSHGTINKSIIAATMAPAQGAINKKVIGMKAATTQGAINRIIF